MLEPEVAPAVPLPEPPVERLVVVPLDEAGERPPVVLPAPTPEPALEAPVDDAPELRPLVPPEMAVPWQAARNSAANGSPLRHPARKRLTYL